MSVEAAFLAALKANPADDTVRLVYADWLDESGRPDHAAYLRAVVALTTAAPGAAEYADAAERLYPAAARTDPAWRGAVGGRFDLVLVGYGPAHKIAAVKVVREVTGMGLAEAKAIAESVPTPVFSWKPFEVVLPHLLAFGHYAGSVEAVIRPTAWPDGAGPETVFDVELLGFEESLPWQTSLNTRHPWGAGRLADALGIPVEDAAERLRNFPAVLATGLAPAAVADFLRRVRMALNVHRQLPADALRLIPRPAT